MGIHNTHWPLLRNCGSPLRLSLDGLRSFYNCAWARCLFFSIRSFSVLTWYLYYGIYSLFKQIQASREIQRPLIPPPTQQTNSYPSYTKI